MIKRLYKLTSAQIYDFGSNYLHHNFDNFLNTWNNSNEKDITTKIIDILMKNVIDHTKKHINRLEGLANNLLSEHKKLNPNSNVKNLKDLLNLVQKIYADTSSKDKYIYTINQAKDILMNYSKLKLANDNEIMESIDSLKNTLLSYYGEIINFTEERRRENLPYAKTSEILSHFDKSLGKTRGKNFSSLFNEEIETIKKIGNKKDAFQETVNLANKISNTIYTKMGDSFEEILTGSFIDSVLVTVLDEKSEGAYKIKRHSTGFHDDAVADITLNLTKFDIGFSVKHFDTDMSSEKPYLVPDNLDVLFAGAKENNIKFYKYLKNNIFFHFENSGIKKERFNMIVDFEGKVTILRILSRFFDGIYEEAQGSYFIYDYKTGEKKERDIIPAVFWITKTRIFWTHDLLRYFLKASLVVGERKKTTTDGFAKNFDLNGVFPIRLFERGTRTGTRYDRGKLRQYKLDSVRESELNYWFLAKKAEGKMKEYIGKMGSNLSFYKEARMRLLFSQLPEKLERGGGIR